MLKNILSDVTNLEFLNIYFSIAFVNYTMIKLYPSGQERIGDVKQTFLLFKRKEFHLDQHYALFFFRILSSTICGIENLNKKIYAVTTKSIATKAINPGTRHIPFATSRINSQTKLTFFLSGDVIVRLATQ